MIVILILILILRVAFLHFVEYGFLIEKRKKSWIEYSERSLNYAIKAKRQMTKIKYIYLYIF